MNTDVTAYEQDQFRKGNNPLAVTATIPVEIPVKFFGDSAKFLAIQCNSKNHNKAVMSTLSKYRKVLQVITKKKLLIH